MAATALVPTGSWGRPVRVDRVDTVRSRAPVSRRPFIAAPPPPPPVLATDVAVPRRLRRWWIEAAGAVVLLGLLAALFRPAAPPEPSPAQLWLTTNSHTVAALMSDIAAAEADVSAGGTALERLDRDLLTARQTPPPPDPDLERAWHAALGDVGSAVDVLLTPGQSPATRTSARNALAAAADGLLALTQAGQASVPIYPH